MQRDQCFLLNRKIAFDDWTKSVNIPGLNRETYTGVFDYILQHQSPNGTWVVPDRKSWATVQTAVVLKSLALIKFSPSSTWSVLKGEKEHSGGVKKALQFLIHETTNNPNTVIGEDIWDTCQVLLALHAFGHADISLEHVKWINKSWEERYATALMKGAANRWTGPAYLAAMVEVISRYKDCLESESALPAIVKAIVNLEKKDNQGNGTGLFPTYLADRADETRWNTSLVLRALCSLSLNYRALVKADLIERVVGTQIQDLQEHMILRANSFEEPMYIARCLDGLQAAMQRVSGNLQPKIAEALKLGNDRLNTIMESADLKAYTAMAEYLAAITVSIPAGLLFDVGSELTDNILDDAIPKNIENGFRLVWLSDLHIADDSDGQPSKMSVVPGFLGSLKYIKGNALTQYFQKANLTRILDRVVEIQPNHILITGDITNYAQPNQFLIAKNCFLETQAKIKNAQRSGGVGGALDPKLWTVLPGNHDVTTEKHKGGLRKNLGLFFETFGELYGNPNDDFDDIFPLEQTLPSSTSIKIRLIALDSNVESPVWVVGVNARGNIDDAQMKRLSAKLNRAPKEPSEIVIVALHHHPIVVPEMVHDTEDYFLSLNEAIGRKLVALCKASGVSAILHGHFHRFSKWTGSGGNRSRSISIIGSPAGTVNIPNMSNEFLELREARIEAGGSVRHGFALYRHAQNGGTWGEEYLNVFID